jgi:hypothetical protein
MKAESKVTFVQHHKHGAALVSSNDLVHVEVTLQTCDRKMSNSDLGVPADILIISAGFLQMNSGKYFETDNFIFPNSYLITIHTCHPVRFNAFT